ncbi:MAG: HAMP domain-containing sensor histidine kinase, partial [Bacteroidota bacterium]|nr:HAMP domain-containing histidine kinase [Candidatus Kapabacteria bacterium]MDW8221257.1 HAMP domain-containing sensor histidine kinase [Bacteroidota bacterium]
HKQITIQNIVPVDTSVFADERMVEAILRNLLYNALKFTHVGGTVTISSQEQADAVRISVQDTGVGISEEDIVRLLEPDQSFSTVGTVGEKGTGLGILFCRELIEKNGGTLEIESVKHQGSTFSFTLPKPQAPH